MRVQLPPLPPRPLRIADCGFRIERSGSLRFLIRNPQFAFRNLPGPVAQRQTRRERLWEGGAWRGRASKTQQPRGGIGRRSAPRPRRPPGHVGSTPTGAKNRGACGGGSVGGSTTAERWMPGTKLRTKRGWRGEASMRLIPARMTVRLRRPQPIFSRPWAALRLAALAQGPRARKEQTICGLGERQTAAFRPVLPRAGCLAHIEAMEVRVLHRAPTRFLVSRFWFLVGFRSGTVCRRSAPAR